MTLPAAMFGMEGEAVTSGQLGMTRISEGRFEAPDGSDIEIDTDLVGNAFAGTVLAGPLQRLHAGKNRVKIWSFEGK